MAAVRWVAANIFLASASPSSLTRRELSSCRGCVRIGILRMARPGGVGQLAAGTLAGPGGRGARGRCLRLHLASAPGPGTARIPVITVSGSVAPFMPARRSAASG